MHKICAVLYSLGDQDAVKLSVEKYCSVSAMLRNSVNIQVRWKMLEKAGSEQK
jgi:hypothetical protein